MSSQFLRIARIAAIFALSIFVLSGCAAMAQEITGAVTGAVTDPAGAAVAAAEVRLTNNGTGAVQSAKTDADGNFRFLLLPPGQYSVRAAVQGFKTVVREGLIVEVDRSVAVPLKLEIGQVSETVEVTGASPLLEPNTATLGTALETQKVEELPLNGRNPMGLLNLVPTVKGIGYFGGQVLSSWRLAAVSIGGGQPLTNGYLVDGVANDKMVDSGPMTFLTVESTEEVKVQTNGMSAEFGRTSGGVISMITKGGSNNWHGSLFEFLKNKDLNANDFFANRAGRAIAPYKVNQYGGSVSGPAIKDKLFFFFNFEGYRERSTSIETVTAPTNPQRTGDFSGLTTAAGALIQVYDPYTTRPDPANPGKFLRDAFAGNVIPPSRINAVGANILKFYPSPNLPGLAANDFLQSAVPIDKDTETARVDYNLTPVRRIAARFTDDRLTWGFANFFGNLADVDGRSIKIPRRGLFLGYTDALSPTLLLDVRSGFNHQTEAFNTPSQGYDITQLGLPASLLNQSQSAPGAKQGTFPRVSVSDLTTFGGTNASANHTNSGSVSATVTKIQGSHTWKAGYEYRLYQRNEFGINYPVGSYNFTRAFTQGPNPDVASATSGYSVASLLLGTPASGTAGISAADTVSLKYNAMFVQHDWKVNQKLTLNLGLRWDKDGSPTDRYNVFVNFDPTAASPLTVPGLNVKGALAYPGVGGRSRSLLSSPNTNFQPRFGLAYQYDDKTVVRAAYGIAYVPSTQAAYSGSTLGFSATTPMITSNDGGRTPANTLSNPFPNGLTQPSGSSLGGLTGVGNSVTASLFNLNRGYTEQWNVTLQRQQFKNWLFELGYVGNHGVHMFMYNQNLNWLPDSVFNQYGSSLNTTVANPFFGVIKSGPLASATVQQAQLLLPYPQYTALPGTLQGGLVTPFSYAGSSIYHAGTAKVERRFSNGLSVLAAYSKSKMIDIGDNLSQVRPGGVTGTGVQDWSNLKAERSKSLYDVPQRLVITALYELPFGKSGNKIYKNAIGGWQANAIATFQSGLPIPLQFPTSVAGADRPSVIAGVSDKPATQTLNQWFNTAAFTAPAPFTYGTVSRTLPDISGDGLVNLDFSLFKNFTVGEKYKMQFRTEAFNLTNTPTFEIPGTTFGTPTFGVVSAQAFTPKPRIVQLGLRMTF